MELQEVICKRKSIRAYTEQEIPAETITAILEAARLAPSWKNLQCWRWLILRQKKQRQALAEVLGDWNRKVISSAPVVVVLCADPAASGVMGDKQYYLVDAAIAMEHLVLAATAHGLGTCWVGAFDEEKVKNALHIPPEFRVVALSPLGYPAQEPPAQPRKPLAEIAFFDVWGKTQPE